MRLPPAGRRVAGGGGLRAHRGVVAAVPGGDRFRVGAGPPRQRGEAVTAEPIKLVPVPRLDVRCRLAHDRGEVVLYQPHAPGGWMLVTMRLPPPGDDLPSWPAVSP